MSNDAALAQLVEVFPDAEPGHIASVLASAGSVEATMERMLGTDYPKRVEAPSPAPAAVRVTKRKNPEADEDLLAPVGIVAEKDPDPVETTLKTLAPLFPDCEPAYMRELVTQLKGKAAERSQQASAVLIEKKYPRVAPPAPEMKKPKPAETVSVSAIMKKDWYKPDNTPVSAAYSSAALIALCNRHRRIPKNCTHRPHYHTFARCLLDLDRSFSCCGSWDRCRHSWGAPDAQWPPRTCQQAADARGFGGEAEGL